MMTKKEIFEKSEDFILMQFIIKNKETMTYDISNDKTELIVTIHGQNEIKTCDPIKYIDLLLKHSAWFVITEENEIEHLKIFSDCKMDIINLIFKFKSKIKLTVEF